MRRIRTSSLQFLLALVLSLALWTFVSFTKNPTELKTFVVPITIVQPSAGLIVVDPATGAPFNGPVTTSVQVSGPQVDVDQLRPDNFTATADLSGLNAGEQTVPISITPVRGVRIRSYTPEALRVQLEQRISKTYNVQPVTQGRLPFLFENKSTLVANKSAVVTGSPDLLAQVARVIVTIDLQNRTQTYSEQKDLVPVDGTGKPVVGVTVDPAQTSVTVSVTPRVEVQRVAVEPQTTGFAAPGYTTERIDWTPRYVDIIASVEITGSLRTEPIDLTDRTESFTQTVRLVDIDETIQLLGSDLVTVTIPIVPIQIPANYPLFVPVTPINIGPGLQATAQPPSLTILAKGTFEQLQQLENATVQATLDLNGYGPGTYTLPVTIDLPPGLQIVGDQPEATVTITALPPPPTATLPAGG